MEKTIKENTLERKGKRVRFICFSGENFHIST